MSVSVRHQMYKDLIEILKTDMIITGYKFRPNYPEQFIKPSSAPLELARERIEAFNVTFQYFNLLHRQQTVGPKPVYWSKELIEKKETGLISEDQMKAIEAICKAANSGGDIMRFMSTSIEDASFTDKMYSDWRIAHFHLNARPSAKPQHRTKVAHFVERTGAILFAFPHDAGLFFLDIRMHGRGCAQVWSERGIVEILHNNFPYMVEEYVRKGPDSGSKQISTTGQIKILREKNTNYILTMSDGTEYYPFGGGLTSGGSNLKVRMATDFLIYKCKVAVEEIESRADELIGYLEKVTGIRLTELHLTLTLDQRNQPVFVEKTQDVTLGSQHEYAAFPLRYPPSTARSSGRRAAALPA